MESVPRNRKEAGQQLRDARSACRLSLEQLARKIGGRVTKDSVSQVESGERAAPSKLFDAWSRALEPAGARAVRTALLIGRQKDDTAAGQLAGLLDSERARADDAERRLAEAEERHRQEIEALTKDPGSRMTPWRAQLLWRLGDMDSVEQPPGDPAGRVPREGPTPDGAAMALCALIDAAVARRTADGLPLGLRTLRVLVTLAAQGPARLAGALAGLDGVASAIDPEASERDFDAWSMTQHVELRRPPPMPPPAETEAVAIDLGSADPEAG